MAQLQSTSITGSLIVTGGITGSFTGSIVSPGSTTQVLYNNGGVISANSGFVYSGSNVGIGTTTPAEKLSLAGTTGTTFGLSLEPSGWNGAKHRFTVPTSGDTSMWSFNWNGTTTDYTYAPSTITLGQGLITFSTTGSANAPAERMRITPAGDVAVGTTAALLNTSGRGNITINGSSESIMVLSNGGAWKSYLFNNGTNTILGATGDFSIATNNGGTTVLYANTSGNVGIGTTSPSTKLDVDGIGKFGSYAYIGTNVSQGYYQDSANGAFRSLSGATNPGFYFQNYAGATTTMFVGLDGTYASKVGIGTTTPGYDLHIARASSENGILTSFGASNIYLSHGGWAMGAGKFGIGDASTPTITFDTVNDRLGVGSGITNPAYLIDAYSTNATTNIISIGGTTNYSLFQSFNNSGVFDLAIDNSAGSGFSQGAYSRVLHSTGAYPLVISTNSTERMRILSGGNVGIGTTTPDIFSRGYDRILGLNSSTGVAKIELNGSSSSGIDFGQAGSRVAEINGFTTGLEIGTVGSTPIYFTPNGTTRVAIASGGNVGIGETSPTQKLQVSGNIFASTGNDGGFILEGGNAILRQSGNQMGFNVSGSERMRITDGGNVGIGTTSPNTKLQVNSFYTYGTINDQLTLNGTVSGGTSSNPAYYGGITMTGEGYEWGAIRAIQTNPVSSWTSRLAFYTMNGSGGQPAVERMSIDNSGNVGIGTTNPGAKLAVNGTTLTGNVSSGAYVTPSQLHVGGDGTAQISLEDVGAATAAIALDGDKFAFGHQSSTPSYSFRYSNTYNGDYANTGTIFTSLNPTTSYINSTYVGIGTTTPGYKLDVNGNTNVNGTLTATVKSFIIDHPTKENKKLQYGVLEGPEHSVYVRGKLTNTNVIQLPDYWHALVHEDSITVNLTAIGKPQEIWVEEITDTYITVGSSNLNVSCFYTVFAERKDVDKLVTEFDKE